MSVPKEYMKISFKSIAPKYIHYIFEKRKIDYPLPEDIQLYKGYGTPHMYSMYCIIGEEGAFNS